MTGREMAVFMRVLVEDSVRDLEVERVFRVLEGPYRNLHVKVKLAGEGAPESGFLKGRYEVLGKEHRISQPVANLERIEETYEVNRADTFTDLLKRSGEEGVHKALLIDGDFVLQRAFGDYPDTVTEEGLHTGGALGFYLSLLRLKELFVEYSVHVIWGVSRHQIAWDEVSMQILRSVTYSLSKVGRCEMTLQEYKDNRDWCVSMGRGLGYYVYEEAERDLDLMSGVLRALHNTDHVCDRTILFTTADAAFLVEGEGISLYAPKVNAKGCSVQIKEAPAGCTSLWSTVVKRLRIKINRHDHDYKECEVLGLLREFELDRELRYWDRSQRVLQSKW
jgi:hypothetical protein